MKRSLHLSAPHLNRQKIRDEVRKNREWIRGLGIITGGAGDDPACVATCTAAGATTGPSPSRLMPLLAPLMIAVQNVAARTAPVTGKSLPETVRGFYSQRRSVARALLLNVAGVVTTDSFVSGCLRARAGAGAGISEPGFARLRKEHRYRTGWNKGGQK